MEAITLNNLAIGQKATIITVGGEGILRAPPLFRYGADPQNKGYGA